MPPPTMLQLPLAELFRLGIPEVVLIGVIAGIIVMLRMNRR